MEWVGRLTVADWWALASAATAAVAAVFWFVSAYGDLPRPVAYLDVASATDPFFKAVKFGARMNRWAAGFAAVSALCAAAASVASVLARTPISP